MFLAFLQKKKARRAIGQRPYRQNNALCHQKNPCETFQQNCQCNAHRTQQQLPSRAALFTLPLPLEPQRGKRQCCCQKKQKMQRVIRPVRDQLPASALAVHIHKRCAQQVDARQKRERPDAQPGKAPSAQCGDALPPGSRVVGHFSRPSPEWDFIFYYDIPFIHSFNFPFFASDARLSRFLFPLFVLY